MHELVEKSCVRFDLCISIAVVALQTYFMSYLYNNPTLLLPFVGYSDLSRN